jgi:F0F1-type ATP synthase membrane subunit c/vacuolar-type H+-ATPase subunit K
VSPWTVLGAGMAVGVGGEAVAVGDGGVMAGGTVASAVDDGMTAGDGVAPQPARSKSRDYGNLHPFT